MNVNLNELKKRDKYINCQKHDTLPLLLWNYSHACQYDKAWDEYTLMCRGLITDLEGKVVAMPFKKFFNLGERPETNLAQLPAEVPTILEKLDGSMVVVYKDGDKICGATRGSFNSDQAKWATQWLQKRFTANHFRDDKTYIFEAIYPENRIVVDYKGYEGLVFLGMIDHETGLPVEHGTVLMLASLMGLRTPKVINAKDIASLAGELKNLSSDQEGYVVRYSNGLMLKMKGEEYVRLHRLITGFSSRSIWECLMNKQNILEAIKDVPDEFYNWVMSKADELQKQFKHILKTAKSVRRLAEDMSGSRKEQAIYILNEFREYSSIVFSMLDGKDYEKIIWKMIKPEYELPFKTDDN